MLAAQHHKVKLLTISHSITSPLSLPKVRLSLSPVTQPTLSLGLDSLISIPYKFSHRPAAHSHDHQLQHCSNTSILQIKNKFNHLSHGIKCSILRKRRWPQTRRQGRNVPLRALSRVTGPNPGKSIASDFVHSPVTIVPTLTNVSLSSSPSTYDWFTTHISTTLQTELTNRPLSKKIHIGPYAAKTGAKPNTIIKRLGEIKKRNNLNIVTTNATSGAAAGVGSPGLPAPGGRANSSTAADTKPKVKREKKATTTAADATTTKKRTKQNAPAALLQDLVKAESDALSTTTTQGLGIPSPAESTLGSNTMPAYMAQKRGLADDGDQEEGVTKKVKTEGWAFS